MAPAPFNLEDPNKGYFANFQQLKKKSYNHESVCQENEQEQHEQKNHNHNHSHNHNHNIQVTDVNVHFKEGFACENGLDLACPHQGCQVKKDGDKYVCPCHNSQFKLDGSLIQGPATTGLKKCQQ